MATKEETPPPPPGEAEAKPKSKKLLIIVIAASVVMLSLIAVVVVLLLKPAPADPLTAAAAAAEAQKAEEAIALAKQPVFERLETFTVNLLPEKGDQYLQAEITLEIDSIESTQRLKALMPRVRNQVNLILAGKKASEIMPKEGKEILAADIRTDINAIVAPGMAAKAGAPPGGPVLAVLFTSFIIQ